MRVSFLIMGILFIIGAVVNYTVTPKIIDNVNALTNSLETNILPTVDNKQTNSAYTQNMADVTSKMAHLNSGMMELIEKVSEYTSWATVVVGIGLVLCGVLTNNNRNQKSQLIMFDSDALETLKMRLAKGEITKKEFNNIKQDVQ